MKNKSGWGLNEMLVLCAILVGFLLLVVILVNRLYSNLEVLNKNAEAPGYTYATIESKLETKAKEYYKENKKTKIITTDELIKDGYLTTKQLMAKNESSPCIGYVSVEGDDFKAFISCENYETEGY